MHAQLELTKRDSSISGDYRTSPLGQSRPADKPVDRRPTISDSVAFVHLNTRTQRTAHLSEHTQSYGSLGLISSSCQGRLPSSSWGCRRMCRCNRRPPACFQCSVLGRRCGVSVVDTGMFSSSESQTAHLLPYDIELDHDEWRILEDSISMPGNT